MTDTLLDIPTRSAFVTTHEPAFDFMRLIAGREDGRDVATRFFSQPETRTVDEDLIDAMINAFNEDEPPKDLNDLRERVDGLGDILAERLSSALAANGALRRSTGRLNPALIETLSDPNADTDDLCPPAEFAIQDLDFNSIGTPGLFDQPGGIMGPGEGATGLDRFLAGCAAYALDRFACARAENNEDLIQLLEEFEDAATTLVCRLCPEQAPRATVKATVARELERLARNKATRHAEERFETGVDAAVAELLAASVGPIVRFPALWLDRMTPFPETQPGDEFIEDTQTPTATKLYELSVQLKQVLCKIETSPKWGKDEFRIATAARVDGKAVASASYAADFDENAPGNKKNPKLEFFKFDVPQEAGKTKKFTLVMQPFESDAVTVDDLAPYLKTLGVIIEVLVNVAVAVATQRFAQKLSEASAARRYLSPEKIQALQRALFEAADKTIIKDALENMVEEGAIGFFKFFNGPDPFTLVKLTGSVTSNGPKKPPTWQFSLSGGTVDQGGQFATSVKEKTGQRNINQLKIHEVNVDGSGQKPFVDPKIGAYLLDMAVVVREKPKSA